MERCTSIVQAVNCLIVLRCANFICNARGGASGAHKPCTAYLLYVCTSLGGSARSGALVVHFTCTAFSRSALSMHCLYFLYCTTLPSVVVHEAVPC
jgi:hypothetical protein